MKVVIDFGDGDGVAQQHRNDVSMPQFSRTTKSETILGVQHRVVVVCDTLLDVQ